MKKRKNKPRRNPMRAKLIKEMAKGKTLTEASNLAGYKHVQSAHKALTQAQKDMPSILDSIGLTKDVLAKKYLAPLLEAKKIVFFQNGGVVMDKRTVADLGIRQTSLDMAFRLQNAYPNRLEIEHSGIVAHVLTETDKKEAEECLKRIAAFEANEDSDNVIDGEVVDM